MSVAMDNEELRFNTFATLQSQFNTCVKEKRLFLDCHLPDHSLTVADLKSLSDLFRDKIFPHNTQLTIPNIATSLSITINVARITSEELPWLINFITTLHRSPSYVCLTLQNLTLPSTLTLLPILEATINRQKLMYSDIFQTLLFDNLNGLGEQDLLDSVDFIVKNSTLDKITFFGSTSPIWKMSKETILQIAARFEKTPCRTKLLLWSHDHDLKEAAQKWDEDEKISFAVLQLKVFLACGFKQLSYGNLEFSFPFSLTVDQVSRVVSHFKENEPKYAEYIDPLIKTLLPSPADRKALEKLTNTNLVDAYFEQLLNSKLGYEMSLFEQRDFTIADFDCEKLIEFINDRFIPKLTKLYQYEPNTPLALHLNINGFEKEPDTIFHNFFGVLNNNAKTDFLIKLKYTAQEPLQKASLQKLVEFICKHERIRGISLAELPMIQFSMAENKSLFRTIKNYRNISTIQFWPNWFSPAYAEKKWTEEEQTIFIEIQMQQQINSNYSSSALFPFPLTLERYKSIFAEYLNLQPNQFDKIAGWISGSYLTANQKQILQHNFDIERIIKGNTNNITSIDLHAWQFETEAEAHKLLKAIEEASFDSLSSITLNLSLVENHAIPTLLQFLAILQGRTKQTLHLKIHDPDFRLNKGQRILNLIDPVHFKIAKIRVLNFNGLNLGELKDPVFHTQLFQKLESIETNKDLVLCLSDCRLSMLGSEKLLSFFDCLLRNKQFQNIDLTHNQLFDLGKECIQKIAEACHPKRLTQIKLDENGLERFGLKTLSSLVEHFQKAGVERLSLCEPSNFQSQFSNQCTISNDNQVARLFLKLLEIAPDFNMNFCVPSSLAWLCLTEAELNEYLEKFIQSSNLRSAMIASSWLPKLEISYENRLSLFKQIFSKMTYLNLANFHLRPEDRLSLFLNNFTFSAEGSLPPLFRQYDLYHAELPASPFIDLFEDEDLNSFDCMERAESLKEMVSEIRKICSEKWPKTGTADPFYFTTLAKLENWALSDDYEVLKFSNMVYWFVLTCISLAAKPAFPLENLNVVFNEIRDYADPEMRYKASATLIDKVSENEAAHSLFSKLAAEVSQKKLPPHLILPAIFLCRMVGDKNKAPQELKRIQSILSSIPAHYKQGHHFRPLVSAIQHLSDYPDYSSEDKLILIEKMINSEEQKLLDTMIVDFVGSELRSLTTASQSSDATAGYSPDTEAKLYSEKQQYLITLLSESGLLKVIDAEKSKFAIELLNYKKSELSQRIHQVLERKFLNNDLTIDAEKSKLVAELLDYKKSKLSKNIHNAVQQKLLNNDLTPESKDWKKLSTEEQHANANNRKQVCKILSPWIHQFLAPSSSADEMTFKEGRELSITLGLTDIFEAFKMIDEAQHQEVVLNTKAKSLIRRIQTEITNYLMPSVMKEQLSAWLLIQGLCALNDLGRINPAENLNFKALGSKLFQEYFQIDPKQFAFYPEAFAGKRNESALFTYLGKIRSLPNEKRTDMEKAYNRFIQSVLSAQNQDFYKLRYDETLNPHLKAIFENKTGLKEKWMKGQKYSLLEFIKQYQIKAKPHVADYLQFFKNKVIQNKHLPPQNYPELVAYLNSNNEKEKKLILESLKKATSEISHYQTRKMNVPASLLRASAEVDMIELMRLNSADLGTKNTQLKLLSSIHQSVGSLKEGDEFQNDLSAKIQSIRNSSDKDVAIDPRWTIMDTDDFWTAFMIGTDVPGSCQRVDGSAHLNKSLLGYVLNGNMRFLTIQDETGKTVVRCVIILDHDPAILEPVLYQEEIYPESSPQQFRNALIQLAKLRAEELNLSLVTSDAVEDTRLYENPLQSYGGIAPFVYRDALHGQQPEGKYTISKSYVLYSPYYLLSQQLSTLFKAEPKAESIAQVIFDYAVEPAPIHFAYKPMPQLKAIEAVKEEPEVTKQLINPVVC